MRELLGILQLSPNSCALCINHDFKGWDPKELHDKSFYDIVHPEEEESAKRLH